MGGRSRLVHLHQSTFLNFFREILSKVEEREGFGGNFGKMSSSVDLSSYRDQHFKGSRNDQERLLRVSTTMYVGNLSFFTTEEQLYELFGKCGEVKKIIMGLDKFKRTPCGFCFVEYYTRADTENAMRYINGTRLDDRIIRTDFDAGFIEGRQYGRGKSGGQVRDEYRTDFDSGRGGYGKIVQQKLEQPDFFAA